MSWGSYSFLYGPVIAVVAVIALLLVARWATGGRASLIERPAIRGGAEEYGLMIPVASPPSAAAGRRIVTRLSEAGVRSQQVLTSDGRRVMVWAEDVPRARSVLDGDH